MFACDITDSKGKFQKQVVFDSSVFIDLVEKYLLEKDIILPLDYVAKVYEIK